MSGYGLGYVNQAKSAIKPARKVRKKEKMKLTLKQRFRNWLNDTNDEADVPQLVSESGGLSSEGLRLQVYKASGGYVVETRSYDQRNDRNNYTMHVITEDEDLGERIGKIIMMEALRG